jgi:predicted ATPase
VGDFDTAQKLMAILFHLAEQSGDEGLLLEAHHSGWTTEWALGNTIAAEEHVKNGLELYRPEVHHTHIHLYGHDPKACAVSIGARNLWMLGYPDQAHQRAQEGLALSEEFEHPFSSAFARWGGIEVKLLRGELVEAAEDAREFLAFVREHRFPLFIAMAMLFQGAVLVEEGKGAAGMTQIREVQNLAESIGAHIFQTWVLSEFLEACLTTGAIGEGLRAVEREIKKQPLTGQRAMESEIRRLYGELMLAKDPDHAAQAEAEFQLAVQIAQRQNAKSLELRAVMSLARLWLEQGKVNEAREHLSEIYNWFTEGFDTQDLKEAKAMLDKLER